jgi:hypothetical protein
MWRAALRLLEYNGSNSPRAHRIVVPDPCAGNDCDTENGACVPEDDDYTCACKAGYTLANDGKSCAGACGRGEPLS